MRGCKIEIVAAALRTAEEESTRTHGSGDGTSIRLQRELGIWPVNVNKSLDKLKSQGRAHIYCWTHSTNPAPVWVSGPGQDAVRIPRTPEYVRDCKRNKQIKKAAETPRAQVTGLGKQITEECIERARRVPQTWYSALEAA